MNLCSKRMSSVQKDTSVWVVVRQLVSDKRPTVRQWRWLLVVVRLHESEAEFGEVFVRNPEARLQSQFCVLEPFSLQRFEEGVRLSISNLIASCEHRYLRSSARSGRVLQSTALGPGGNGTRLSPWSRPSHSSHQEESPLRIARPVPADWRSSPRTCIPSAVSHLAQSRISALSGCRWDRA